jgi:hypothetical protein
MESLGYSAISMPDHLGNQSVPVPALAAVAVTIVKPLLAGKSPCGTRARGSSAARSCWYRSPS